MIAMIIKMIGPAFFKNSPIASRTCCVALPTFPKNFLTCSKMAVTFSRVFFAHLASATVNATLVALTALNTNSVALSNDM